MGVYIGKRVLSIIPIILFSSFLMFVMIRVGPVDPAEAYLAAAHIHPDDEVLAAKRHEFGLDQPLLAQYVQSVTRLLRLDFGNSYISNMPVWEEVAQKLPATIQLASASILLALVVSIPLGVLSAIYKNRLVDHVIRGLLISVPVFPCSGLDIC